MSSYIHESVYEGNQGMEEEDNVEIIQEKSPIQDIKLSSDSNYILIITKEGFKLYDILQDQIFIDEKNLKLGKIYNIDFFENSGNQFVIVLDFLIVIWDQNQRQVIKRFPVIQTPQQISFCDPFIIAGIKQQNENIILVLNIRTDQAYRYLQIQNLNGQVIFVNNKNKFNCILTYLNQQGNYLLIDYLHLQTVQGINIKTMTSISDDLIADQQKSSLVKQQIVSSFQIYSKVSYVQACVAISNDSNLLAVSPLVDNQRIYIFSISPQEQPKLKYQLYRGQTKKMLCLFFGSNEMFACISYKNNIHNIINAATIHLYYKMKEFNENENKDQQSLTRFYLKTQFNDANHHHRIKTLLLLINKEKLQVFSSSLLKFEEQLLLDSNLVKKKVLENFTQWPSTNPY